MRIGRDTTVRLEYHVETAREGLGHRAGEFHELSFVAGRRTVLPGLEKALWGRKAGEEVSFDVEPDQGFGDYDQGLVQFIGRSYLAADYDYQAGERFKREIGNQVVSYTVKEVRPDGVMADFNHPLAGQRLFFTVRIREVRPATEAEAAAREPDRRHRPREANDG
ncbi:MAG: FKBP-type peptidyl-prolyl cis-trans isomerase [Proteobacteria bacterium]|nr:FKBP-type peptidyl-prolyl cis-trans isomerase [Pseudomonadota bacterium]MBU1742877.1 FKBP-type peptidyl-prolyl cis-trans isomerase [Pseudomonadota bacterium]